MTRRVLLILPLVIATFWPRVLSSCQCGEKPTAKEALAQSEVIFAGEVSRIEETQVRVRMGDSLEWASVKEVTLLARRRWKGKVEPEMKLVIGVTDCDYPLFAVGGVYLVYCGSSSFLPDRLTASRCGRTDYFRVAKSDLAVLGRGSAVVHTPP